MKLSCCMIALLLSSIAFGKKEVKKATGDRQPACSGGELPADGVARLSGDLVQSYLKKHVQIDGATVKLTGIALRNLLGERGIEGSCGAVTLSADVEVAFVKNGANCVSEGRAYVVRDNGSRFEGSRTSEAKKDCLSTPGN